MHGGDTHTHTYIYIYIYIYKELIFKKKKNINNSLPSEPTSMCNVDVMVEQSQCVLVYKEFMLISEYALTRIDIVKNHSLLFFVLFQSLSNINNASL